MNKSAIHLATIGGKRAKGERKQVAHVFILIETTRTECTCASSGGNQRIRRGKQQLPYDFFHNYQNWDWIVNKVLYENEKVCVQSSV